MFVDKIYDIIICTACHSNVGNLHNTRYCIQTSVLYCFIPYLVADKHVNAITFIIFLYEKHGKCIVPLLHL